MHIEQINYKAIGLGTGNYIQYLVLTCDKIWNTYIYVYTCTFIYRLTNSLCTKTHCKSSVFNSKNQNNKMDNQHELIFEYSQYQISSPSLSTFLLTLSILQLLVSRELSILRFHIRVGSATIRSSADHVLSCNRVFIRVVVCVSTSLCGWMFPIVCSATFLLAFHQSDGYLELFLAFWLQCCHAAVNNCV